jgi:hypothetical protein
MAGKLCQRNVAKMAGKTGILSMPEIGYSGRVFTDLGYVIC